jgi:hypothetical protein
MPNKYLTFYPNMELKTCQILGEEFIKYTLLEIMGYFYILLPRKS